MPAFQDITGRTFGRLTVLGQKRKSGDVIVWSCQCECGNIVEGRGGNLKNGHTQSCGCLNKELSASRIKHGATRKDSHHPLYHIHRGMMRRCYDSNSEFYDDYGGRGITVSKKFHNYNAFRDYVTALEGYPVQGHMPNARMPVTLDRINNAKGYVPGNLRWSDRKQQANNRRSSVFVSIKGVRMTIAQLAEKSVVSYETLRNRLNSGMPVEEAMTKPSRNKNKTLIEKAYQPRKL